MTSQFPGQTPTSILEALNRGIALHQVGRIADAECLYRMILNVQPNHFEALHFLGLIEAQRENYEEANRLISQSLQINSLTSEAYSNHARVLIALKRTDEAVERCDRALLINPRSVEALTHRGNALQDQGQHHEAVASYDKALAIKSDYLIALTNRGRALQSLNRLEEALASHDKALAMNDRFFEALRNRGSVLEDLGRYDQALETYDAALAMKPGDGFVCAKVASIYFKDKDFTTKWILLGLSDLCRALEAYRRKPFRILEIGSWEGASAVFFLRFLPRSTLTCVDTFTGSVEHDLERFPQVPFIEGRFDRNLAEFGTRVEKIKSSSSAAFVKLKADGRQFDLIYVDGSHEYDDVVVDTDGAWHLAAPDSLILWDDYHPDWPGVVNVVDPFLISNAEKIELIYKNWQVLAKKKCP